MTSARDLEVALAEASNWVGQKPGVAAVGQGENAGSPTIDVWISGSPTPRGIPEQLHGIQVRVLLTGGPIEAQDA